MAGHGRVGGLDVGAAPGRLIEIAAQRRRDALSLLGLGGAATSNAGDMVFADSLSSELATITGGDTTNGYTASFTVGLNG